MHPAYMMQRFLFRCKGRTFSANNKEKTHFSSLFVIFLDERDAKGSNIVQKKV
jgi:hypothetical protein